MTLGNVALLGSLSISTTASVVGAFGNLFTFMHPGIGTRTLGQRSPLGKGASRHGVSLVDRYPPPA